MIKALAITGPTASGKTALSLYVAEKLGCEIISCDSMQIYREMNIGTAKATADEQARVPHHLINAVNPPENYSAERYRTEAMEVARDITRRGKIPLFVGGTGLYIDTVIRGGVSESPESDPVYRENILKEVKSEEDRIALWERLRSVDPESAEKTHYNNVKRVVRALEIYDKTGKSKTLFDKESQQGSPDISVGMITLDFESRELLYDRVDKRVDIMMSDGIYDEVKSLYERGLLPEGSTAREAIGYKEIISAIEGECTLDEATEEIKLSSRRYAKRQLTWFRHEKSAKRLTVDEGGKMKDTEQLVDEALSLAKEFLTY